MGIEPPRIAVVVPSWNCLVDLRECIASLDAQEGVALETVVVDNGSTDGSVAYLKEAGVEHIALPRNLGFASAVNLGFEATTTPIVATVNSDTVLEPDALATLARALIDDPELGGVQPRILSLKRGTRLDPEDPDARIYSLGQALTADGRAREDGIGLPQGRRGYEAREIFGVCGAACVYRRELLDQVGGFDESYFAFYEDVELNVRARIAAWKFRLIPDAVVWHVGSAAWHAGFDRPDAENARLVARNRICTQVRFMPLRSLPRIAVVELGAMFRALVARRFLLTSAGKGAALLRMPQLLRFRRQLKRGGDLKLAQEWLGESHRSATEVIRHPLPPVGTPPTV